MHKTTTEIIRRMFKKEKQCLRIMGCDFGNKLDEVSAAERDFECAVERLNGID